MTEEDISSSGQFSALSATEATTSYQPPSSTAAPSTPATPVAPVVAESTPPASQVSPASQPTTQEIDRAIAAANANLASANRQLDYRVDSATGKYIAVIRNSQTGEVLQQVPGADVLALARWLTNWAPGQHMLFDVQA